MRSDQNESNKPTEVDTPWEFYPDDDLREEPPKPAETAAMHVEQTVDEVETEAAEDTTEVVVHYLHDEDPEVPDLTEPRPDTDSTAQVDDLLEEQHYLPPEDDAD